MGMMMWASSSVSLSPSLTVPVVLSSTALLLLLLQLWTTSPKPRFIGIIPLVSASASLHNSSDSRGNIWRKSIHGESLSSLALQSDMPWSRGSVYGSNFTTRISLGDYTTHTRTSSSVGESKTGLKRAEEISLLLYADEHGDNNLEHTASTVDGSTHSFLDHDVTLETKTKESNGPVGSTKPRRMAMDVKMDMEQIMNDMGVYNDKDNNKPTFADRKGYRLPVRDNFSSIKVIPDEHHVSAFLNKGVAKRFLFLNDKFGNPLSITITPCTSILLWSVKFWPVLETGTQPPETVKTYRTQRTVTFTESSARRGVYSIDIRPLHWDSYVHLYATSYHSEPIREFTSSHDGLDDTIRNYISTSDSDFHKRYNPNLYNEDRAKFYQHTFTHADTFSNYGSESNKFTKKPMDNDNNPFNFPSSSAEDHQTNTNVDGNIDDITKPTSSGTTNKPRIWVKRLRGHRLQVKWDSSPINPHLMNYCIVVNTRRDYSSLCSASGERFGVLPPDLMHVAYYGPSSENNNVVMIDAENVKQFDEKYFSNDEPSHIQPAKSRNHLRHQRHKQRDAEAFGRKTRATHDDIVIGCVNKKTNYILNNLHQGRLYYFNVFLRDLSTNVSYPYLRTTLKYETPKNIPNGIRDAKPTKVKLSSNVLGKTSNKPTVVKFNLNKPCNELTIYGMPCGGGSIKYEILLGNKSLYLSQEVDSLDTVKIGMPQRGKYFIKIYQGMEENNQARMAEFYVGKKNKRFPLPKLPAITKLTEDESCRTCDSVLIQWWPSPDPRDNEYCIFLKQEHRKRVFHFKKPNQCDVERSLKSDPYVSHSLCLQRNLTPETMMLTQKLVGLQPKSSYVVQLIVRRHNGKALSYDLHHVKTSEKCTES